MCTIAKIGSRNDENSEISIVTWCMIRGHDARLMNVIFHQLSSRTCIEL